MRRIPARTFLLAAALAAGLILLGSAGAADAPADAQFQTLVAQDAEIIQKSAAAVEKATNVKDKRVVSRNAAAGIKSAALMVATLANDRIGGTDATADGRAAAVRDQAIQIYKAAAEGNFQAVADAARGLAAVKPAAEAKKIDVVKQLGEVTPKDVMHNFLKTSQYGTNAEADIIANAKKLSATPAQAALIAYQVLAMGELNKVVVKGENAAEKKAWNDFNQKMIAAADGLLAASQKKGKAADLGKAFGAVNVSCVTCHDDFK